MTAQIFALPIIADKGNWSRTKQHWNLHIASTQDGKNYGRYTKITIDNWIFWSQVGTICNFREMVARCLGPFNSKIKYKVYYNIGVQNPTYVFLIMYVKSYLASSTEHLSEK